MLKYMLDTNTCIYAMKYRPVRVRKKFTKHSEQLCISAVTAMELLFGAEKSQNRDKSLAITYDFISNVKVLDYGLAAATYTGQIRAELQKLGQPIGAADTMIAGHARAVGLVLVTNNTREFKRVARLPIEDWVPTVSKP